jgi:23S rRNA A2030 N6-methylase RlmJ
MGIVRSEVAQETLSKRFLTRNAIVNHFRRDEDRAKIMELVAKDQKHISDLLHAASVVHAFYYIPVWT